MRPGGIAAMNERHPDSARHRTMSDAISACAGVN
jgi:hypothetical protein